MVFGDVVTVLWPRPILGYICMALRYFSMLCVHGGAAGVMSSILSLEPPARSATMPALPSLQCVVNLTGPFFFIYFIMTLMLTVSELNGGTIPMATWRIFSAVEAARSTLALAPVLSLIFVARRLLGLSFTGANGVLQSWAQGAMSVATWSLQAAGLMCLATGLIMAPVEFDSEGQVVNKLSQWHLGIMIKALRYIAMLLVYGGLLIVIIDMFATTPDSAIKRAPWPPEASMAVF